MATSIGKVIFGMELVPKGFQKGFKLMGDFQRRNTQLANSQKQVSAAQVNALARQEQALRKAAMQAAEMRKRVKEAGGSVGQIGAVTKAFNTLVKQLASGQINMLEFNRAMDSFNAKMGLARKRVKDLTQAQQEAEKEANDWATVLRDLESSAVLALGPLSGLGARIRSLGAIITRGNVSLTLFNRTIQLSTLSVVAIAGGVAGFILAMGKLIPAMVRAGSTMQSLNLRFEAATGSMAAGRRAFIDVVEISRKLGLEIQGLSRSYSRFLAASQGTSLEGEQSRVIFEQVAKAVAALKLEAADVEGVFRALEQIMSKGTVQAEELRGQLGDRIPGAFRIAADAMGVTTQELNKMLKQGQVISEEFVPKFAAQLEQDIGKKGKENVNTFTGAWNRLKTETFLTLTEFDKAIPVTAVLTSIMNAASSTMMSFTGDMEEAATQSIRLANGLDGVGKEAKKAGEELKTTAVLTKFKEDIEDTAAELLAMEEALGFFGKIEGVGIEQLIDYFTVLPQYAKAAEGDLVKMAEIMERILGRDIDVGEGKIDDIAAAWSEVEQIYRELEERIDKITDTPDILADIAQEMDMLARKTEAFRKGADAVEEFENIIEPLEDYKELLEGTTLSEEARAEVLAAIEAALRAAWEAEEDYNEAVDRSKEAIRAHTRELTKYATALTNAQQKVQDIEGRLAAIATGNLSMWEAVDSKVLDMAQSFEKAGIALTRADLEEKIQKHREELERAGITGEKLAGLMDEYIRETTAGFIEANDILERYREGLEETERLERFVLAAADTMANGIVDGLARILTEGESVRDMLHDLAKELLRVALKALILDKIKDFFAGLGLFGAITGPAAPLPPWGSGPAPPAAEGGMWKLTGSGGADKIPFTVMGKPGEIVEVYRPDQAGSRGGSGGVVINQYNNYEGALTPEQLGPILEENNRKVRAQIMQDQARRRM